MTQTNTSWSGMIPVDDTALHTTDTGGPGTPVVYLNGSYADLKHWWPVVADLGTDGWRHVCYDERARGRKSLKSSDYSFEATLRDLDASTGDRSRTAACYLTAPAIPSMK